jgi:NAD(P)-dependent dehydrogenase (short-subunit alcohol dehydrogenase family)
MELSLRGSVAVVTGAGRGLGCAAATRLLAEGSEVALLDLRQEEPVPGTTFIPTDVTDETAVTDAIATVLSAHGRIDVLVNCAGVIGPLGPITRVTPADWRRTLDVNLTGTFLMCRAVLPTMLDRGSGRIVNFASGAAVEHSGGQAPYNASKAGVISLTKTVARDVHLAGVRINAICPGNVDTEFTREFLAQDLSTEAASVAENQRSYKELLAQGLVWQPDEVLDLIVFLVSPAGSHLNGQFIRMSTKSQPQVYH